MSMRVIVAAIASCSIHERGRSSELDPKSSEATMTQSNEDRDNCFFFFWEGDRGLKVSDRKIKDSSSSEFTPLVCLSWDSGGTSLPPSVRTQSEWKKKKKKVALFQHMSGRRARACAPVYVTLCVRLLYWRRGVIFDSNDVGPLQIDRRGRTE